MRAPDGFLLAVNLIPVVMTLLLALSFVHWVRAVRREKAAETRASALLRDLLTNEEYRQLAERAYLAVPSPSRPTRVYRIPLHPGYVRVYESGKLRARLCLQPVQPLPDSDVLLLHKLMIEGNEQEYLRQANVIHGWSWRWSPRR